jgi:leucyl aminopeptidase
VPTYEVKRGKLENAKVEVLAIAAIAAATLEEDHEETPKTPPPPTLGPGGEDVAEAIGVDLDAELGALRFAGDVGEVARVPTRGAIHADAVLVVGLGKEADLDLEAVRKAGAAIARATRKVASVATTVHAAAAGLDPADAAQALVEGLDLAAYDFTAHKSKPVGHDLDQVLLYATRPAAVGEAIARAEVHVAATRLVRDLVNEAPANKRPQALVQRVRAVLRGTGVKVKVLDEKALEEGGYGGILAVGKGSDAPPRLVELSYAPSGSTRHVVLVGKGITFDSGGLSLKRGQAMDRMKGDMAGAAAVGAACSVLSDLGVRLEVTALLPLAENLPGGDAQRPGDVVTIRDGKKV